MAAPSELCPVAARLESDLKDAMRARDKARTMVIRQLKAKAQEAENAAGFSGTKDDAFYLQVIGKYAKTLSKSLDELQRGGSRGEALAAGYREEIAYCEQFLPQPLSDDALQAAVQALIGGGGFAGVKDVGRAMGQLLSRFRGQVEPGRAKTALERALRALEGGAP